MARQPLSCDIYLSSNGDRWLLLRDPADGRSLVRHEANVASGGHVTDIALSAFLAADRSTPEHRALWQMIGILVENEDAMPTALA